MSYVEITTVPTELSFTNRSFDAGPPPHPDTPKWSGVCAVPAIGARSQTHVWGRRVPGRVVGYFIEHGWLGLLLKINPRNMPDWLRRQRRTDGTPLDAPVHTFGIETEQ